MMNKTEFLLSRSLPSSGGRNHLLQHGVSGNTGQSHSLEVRELTEGQLSSKGGGREGSVRGFSDKRIRSWPKKGWKEPQATNQLGWVLSTGSQHPLQTPGVLSDPAGAKQGKPMFPRLPAVRVLLLPIRSTWKVDLGLESFASLLLQQNAC